MNFPDFGVKDRVVLLTGAGRGIGLGMAKALAAGGAAVAIQDIDEDVAKTEADAIVAAGGKAIALGGDLADLSLAEAIVGKTRDALGPIDVLINNASIQHSADFLDQPLERMRRELDVNVLMATRLCQLVIPSMREKKWGRIVNLGSIQGLGGNATMPAYAMSRAALSNLTGGLARKYARDGVTVNCIAPGWFDTYRNRHHLTSPEKKAESGKHVPVGRLGTVDDCSGLCVLLCSRAGEYITGQTIHVNGGLTWTFG